MSIQISPEAFEEFKRLYEEDCPEHPKSDAELMDDAQNLLKFVAIVSKPIPQEKRAEFNAMVKEIKKKELLDYIQKKYEHIGSSLCPLPPTS